MRVLFFLLLPFTIFSYVYELSLGEAGSVLYTYDFTNLLKVERLNADKEVLYSHSYKYNEWGKLISEKLIGDLGEINYEEGIVFSPYHQESYSYNNRGQLISHTVDENIREYTYTNNNELMVEPTDISYDYDDTGNIIRIGDTYFTYNENHYLIRVLSSSFDVVYGYDLEGYRSSKTVNGKKECYQFDGPDEIEISNEEGKTKLFRVPNFIMPNKIFRSIAIETRGAIYAPIYDVQGNIIKLVDADTHVIRTLRWPDPFGKNLSRNSPVPWICVNKHYDPETGLVYFGSRFYCPIIHKWLTPDPELLSSEKNKYCFDNPFFYQDLDGR